MEKTLEQLYHSQLNTFQLARNNYANLEHVLYRTIRFDGFNIRIQYNPDRMISTAAKTDPETLRERKCFLCAENMPAEQKGISYNNKYNIYINPYPIFERHFTVPSVAHSEQLIEGRFEDILELSRAYHEYTLFYNGPQSGASAPDHFHFQMVNRHVMPLETDIENDRIKKIWTETPDYSVSTLENYLRKVIIIKSGDPILLSRIFNLCMDSIGQFEDYGKEPKINLFAWFSEQKWIICMFPRTQLRPRQFFAVGKEQILFSPGCADIAGLIISPRKKDFESYDRKLLADMLGQVTVSGEIWEKIMNNINDKVSNLIY